MTTQTTVDRTALESKVKSMYSDVAANPHGEFHFEMGRAMAERLGYAVADLDRIPADAIDSFAGVGHFFHLAGLSPGERVLDLGSGSGMDSFIAALRVEPGGSVVGVDMTDAQLEKAERLAREHRVANVTFRKAYIEDTGLDSQSIDCVISNGVINLAADKPRVFHEIARVLRPGGRLALADIITALPLPETVVCNADLWAACIGGAAEREAYRTAIEGAGLTVERLEDNREYRFISERARKATAKWGVASVSILARKRD
ncbi:MAG TPA: methyltransferase domain-containing protein [Vicinamibacterales bacterium]|jgi:ubiquinone/menaquinone biosynthesis C-methylase UbiE|nr:methyltransferase domain-containing protein [Vicinamibacterales bacterium]